MGLVRDILDRFGRRNTARIQLVTQGGADGFYSWNGRLYQSDIIRACIRPVEAAIGKLEPKHIRDSTDKEGNRQLKVNPEPYVRFLLNEPNPHMSGQQLRMILANQLMLNNNAFAHIQRDADGYAIGIMPIFCISASAITGKDGRLFLRFELDGARRQTLTLPYEDVIHLRRCVLKNNIFGEPIGAALTPLMDVVTTTDQSVINAVKSSGVLRWLLKTQTTQRKEDLQKTAKEFSEAFLSSDKSGYGVAAIDAKVDATQVTPHDYVPNAALIDRNQRRIMELFGCNSTIMQSSYTEDEWNSFYEAVIEPIALDLQNEFTTKLFSRRERGYGNRIAFSAANLSCASISTKLSLVAMVDRGAMTPNEWRSVLNLAPIEGGDTPIRRLDTQPTTTTTTGGNA